MAGPKVVRFKSGSVIYFEGDVDDKIYIVKSGKVVLISTLIESGTEVREELQPGEFFGVKSSLGRYPREETAQTIGETMALVFTQADFIELMSKNFRLVIKMLKVFSNQLRTVGKKVREILGETQLKMPSTELLKLAEYYYEKEKLDYADHAYKKFLSTYPNARFRERAEAMLVALKRGEGYPGSYPKLYEDDVAVESSPVFISMDDGAGPSPAAVEAPDIDPMAGEIKPELKEVLGKQEFGGEYKLESEEIDFFEA